jgi:hypothetical protein
MVYSFPCTRVPFGCRLGALGQARGFYPVFLPQEVTPTRFGKLGVAREVGQVSGGCKMLINYSLRLTGGDSISV